MSNDKFSSRAQFSCNPPKSVSETAQNVNWISLLHNWEQIHLFGFFFYYTSTSTDFTILQIMDLVLPL